MILRVACFDLNCPLFTCLEFWPRLSSIRLEYSLLSFNQNFMKLADNLEMHNITKEVEFRPDQTIDVIGPSVPKEPIFDLVRSIACLV